MKLLYAHDHKLRKKEDKYYTTGGFSNEVTSRYTDVFENMTLLCRAINTDNIEGCSLISNSKVKIVPVFANRLLPNRRLFDMIKQEVTKADIIMVRLPSLLGLYVAYCCDILHKKYCVEVVGSAWGSYWYKSIIGKTVAFPLELLNKHVVLKAQYVLYVTDDYLQREYPTNGVGCGCTDVVLKERNKEILNARLNRIRDRDNSKKLVLGTLAQIDYKYKGHATVMGAIAELKKRGYDIQYRLAGNGNRVYLNRIAKKYGVADNVIFYGQIRHDDIEQWIDDLDIYIQPSLTEGMPRSVIEALYRGCPVIVSDAGGMYELVDKDYTFEKGNTKDLFEIIGKIDDNDLSTMALRNYIFAEKFDYGTLKNKRNSFYNRIRMEYQDGLV